MTSVIVTSSLTDCGFIVLGIKFVITFAEMVVLITAQKQIMVDAEWGNWCYVC